MSVYPANKTLPVNETATNLINRNYSGYTFKKTVEEHLTEIKNALRKSVEFCVNRMINTPDKEYWLGVLGELNDFRVEAHDANTDYHIYRMKNMTIKEIVDKYDDVTIGEIKLSRK